MTYRELVAALEEECQATRGKVEDFLLALGDVITEALAAGDRVNLPMGQFEVHPIVKDGQDPSTGSGRTVAAVRFRPSVELRKRLKLAELKWEIGELCEECGKRPKKKDPRCSTCKSKRYRAKKEAENR